MCVHCLHTVRVAQLKDRYFDSFRLCIYFDLPDVRARNTYVPQRTFHELARQFDARLPHSTVIEGVPSLRQLTAVSAVAGSDGNSESNSTMTERQLTELLCQQLGLDTTMKEAALWMQAAIKTTYPTDEAYKSDGAAVAAGAVCALFAHLHPGANLTDNRSRLQRSLKVVRNETGATQARIDHWTQIIDAQALKLSWFENLAELPSRGHEARQARVTHGLGSMVGFIGRVSLRLIFAELVRLRLPFTRAYTGF